MISQENRSPPSPSSIRGEGGVYHRNLAGSGEKGVKKFLPRV
jgi:hypothetical protein